MTIFNLQSQMVNMILEEYFDDNNVNTIWDFAEGEGNINSPQGKEMLEQLKSCCSDLKIIGSFEKEIHI